MSKTRKTKKQKRKVEIESAAELLKPLATLDDVTAWVPGNADHVAETTPEWCELVLEMKRLPDADAKGKKKSSPGDYPINQRFALRRHDGELIIEVLDEVLHPNRAGATADTVWRELDKVIDKMMARVDKGKAPHDHDQGVAEGLGRALAFMVTPFDPDEDAIKDIAMERYAIRNRLQ